MIITIFIVKWYLLMSPLVSQDDPTNNWGVHITSPMTNINCFDSWVYYCWCRFLLDSYVGESARVVDLYEQHVDLQLYPYIHFPGYERWWISNVHDQLEINLHNFSFKFDVKLTCPKYNLMLWFTNHTKLPTASELA